MVIAVILLLLLLLLCLTRLGALVRYDGALRVSLRIGLLRLTVLPRKEKKAKKKPKPEKQPEAASAAPEKRRQKLTLEELLSLAETLPGALGTSLHRLRRRLRIDPLRVSVTLGGGDPADLAVLYGRCTAALWTLMPRAEEVFCIPDPAIHLGMDYGAERTEYSAELGLSARVGDLIAVALALALPLLRWRSQTRRARRAPDGQKEATAEN